MAEPIQLFDIGVRGVNVVSAPTDMGLEEVRSAQNAEVVSDKGVGALDQRPGMTRVNVAPLAGSVLMAHDVPADVLVVKTPTLYAGMHSSATANWRMTTDGVTWTPVPVPTKPFSANAAITGFFKNFPKCVSLGHKMYYPDGQTPIGIHSWDGATDATVATVPPAVVGVTIATPPAPTALYEFDTAGATTYSYKVVPVAGASHGAASAAVSTTCKATLDSNNFNVITPASPPVTGATTYDVYRTVGGASQGKIGTIPVVAGAFTTGNGSGATGATWATPAAPSVQQVASNNGVTFSYKIVQTSGSNHSAVSPATTLATGPAAMSVASYFIVTAPVVAATDVFDVYRTAGGPSQGKIGTITYPGTNISDTGLAGDGATAPATAVGLAPSSAYTFTDAALVGDAATAPASASGGSSADAVGILDLITDGTDLYAAVLDNATSDPTVYGRILKYSVGSNAWVQIGAAFPTSAGNGCAAALAFYDGALVYGTFIGIASGNTSYLAGLGTPLPAGGFPETHTTAVSQSTSCLAMFNGILYAGYTSLVAGTAAIIAKRVPIATWSTALTAITTGQYNGFTSMCAFNGRLYAGWTSGDAVNIGIIYSTLDGVTWVQDELLAVGEMPCQMVVFQGSLYVVCGKTGATFNTVTQVLKRTTGGVWSAVDDPTDDFAGCLGIIYQ